MDIQGRFLTTPMGYSQLATRNLQAVAASSASSAAPLGASSFAQQLLAASQASVTANSSVTDLTNMTPNQMQTVAQKLFEAGKIDFTQLFMLENAGIPLGKQGTNGEFIPLSETERDYYRTKPVNYIQTCNDALQFLKQSGHASDPTSGYAAWSGILAALQGLQHPAATTAPSPGLLS